VAFHSIPKPRSIAVGVDALLPIALALLQLVRASASFLRAEELGATAAER
jgi:hypothetical protein